MPKKRTLDRVRADRKAGKAPSTQAGEFIREEIEDIRAGKHGARSAKQIIAIGLSQARRAGVDLPPPKSANTSPETQQRAARDYERGHDTAAPRKVSAKRSQASQKALKRESTQAASHTALASQARSAAARRSPDERSNIAQRAARTKASRSRAVNVR